MCSARDSVVAPLLFVDLVQRLALALLSFALCACAAGRASPPDVPSPPVETGPPDFRTLSPAERAAWLDHLDSVLEEAKLSSEAPAVPEFAQPNPWKRVRDGIGWRIDDAGFVVLDDGRRPMGSRIFARSCFLQHGNSFRRWAAAYSRGISVAHLVATAITESGCSEWEGLQSVDDLSTGLMQITGETCENLLGSVGRPRMTEEDCLGKMAEDPDFSIELAAAYMTQPNQADMTELDPPKVAAAYNAGGLYFDPGNPWRLRSTGNHIDRFVAAYNAYVAWNQDEKAGRRTRSPAVQLSHSASLPQAVESPSALKELTPRAREGDIVFVGDWAAKRGDFYVLINGEWRGSLEDSGS